MVPTSTYILVYGVPVLTVFWCIFLNILGKKLFGTKKDNLEADSNQGDTDKT